jgi:hypothetical protein
MMWKEMTVANLKYYPAFALLGLRKQEQFVTGDHPENFIFRCSK